MARWPTLSTGDERRAGEGISERRPRPPRGTAHPYGTVLVKSHLYMTFRRRRTVADLSLEQPRDHRTVCPAHNEKLQNRRAFSFPGRRHDAYGA